ncbi:copper homeostasis protein CutC [Arthrobacter sp. MMS24-T111]
MAGTLRSGQVPTAGTGAQLELAVENAGGVRLAAAVGAARVELCGALAETEGITPSIGTIGQACGLGLPVHVLVRPRPGDFTYTPEELDVIERDATAALAAGASGVVVGVLSPDGGPDVPALRRIVAAARAVKPDAAITFHRAFDAALAAGIDPAEALSRLERAGVDRVLTSGGAPTAPRGWRCWAGLCSRDAAVRPRSRSWPAGASPWGWYRRSLKPESMPCTPRRGRGTAALRAAETGPAPRIPHWQHALPLRCPPMLSTNKGP